MMHQSDLLNGNFKGKTCWRLCSPQVQNTLEKAKELAARAIFRHRKTHDRNRHFPVSRFHFGFIGSRRIRHDCAKQVDIIIPRR